MNNYEEMSDFEINFAAAKARYHQVEYITEKEWVAVMGSGYRFDPCNDPSDAWRIIVENKIALIPTGKSEVWCAAHNPDIDSNNQIHLNIFEYDSNPLRAACICFLKIKELDI